MSSVTTSSELGQTRRESAEAKADTTKRVSEEILQAEAEKRQAKTERLKAARLAMQAGERVSGPETPRAGGVGKRPRTKA